MYKHFKQLSVFSITNEINDRLTTEYLTERLKQHAFRPCHPQDTTAGGWIDPLTLGDSDRFVVEVGNFLLVAYKTEKKTVPGSALKEALSLRVAAFTEENKKEPTRGEQVGLKEAVFGRLLERAFPTSHVTLAIIDRACQRIYVGDSPKQADNFLTALRKITGTLPVEPLKFAEQSELVLTQWLSTAKLPTGLQLGYSVTLTSEIEQTEVIQFKNQELDSDDIKRLTKAGNLVAALELAYAGTLIFTIDAYQNTLKKLTFTEHFREKDKDIEDDGDLGTYRLAEALLIADCLSGFVADFAGLMAGAETDE
jgi:recombination associated protein RdgC